MFFFHHPNSAPTSRLLAEAFGVPSRMRDVPRAYADLAIRWGSARPMAGQQPANVLNLPEAINRAADKLVALRTLQDHGVDIPAFTTRRDDATYPCLVRSRRHRGATDVRLLMQPNDVRFHEIAPDDYYVSYVPTVAEYRIHVFLGEVIRCQRKHMNDVEQAAQRPWIRNHGQGYIFKGVRLDTCEPEANAAKLAVTALGLDFGAVDVLRAVFTEPVVLEVNTAPAVIGRTARAYCEAFRHYYHGISGEFLDYELATDSEPEDD